MIKTPNVKKLYSDLQKQLFYLIPEKWESIYLYASVTEQILNLETGELFFYYFPRGLLKKNPINVYEIPSKFKLNEEEYIKLVEKLYITIRKLRQEYKDAGERVWTSITIRLVGLKFEIEFDYNTSNFSRYSNIQRHIIWKFKNLNLPIESFSKQDRKLIQEYFEENQIENLDTETYSESIYKRPIKNTIGYNRASSNQEDILENEETEENVKNKYEEQRYTYIKKENKRLKKQSVQDNKEMTYIEQIESQRNAVKSQILNHL